MVLVTQRKLVLAAVDMVLRLNNGNVEFFDTREEYAKKLQELVDARKAEIAARQQGPEGGVEGAVPAPPTAPSGGPQSGSGAAAAPPAVVSASALAGNTPKGRPDFLKPAKTIEGTATEADKNGSAEKPKSGTPGWPFPPSPSLSKNARGKDAEPEAGE